MSSTKTNCVCCDKDYVKSYYKKHLTSKKHLKNQEASGIPLPVVVPQDTSNKTHCECCDKYLSKSYYKKHLKSKRHLKNYEKYMTEQKEQENQNITDEVLTFPVELLNIIFEYKNELEKYEEIITLCDGINKQIEKKDKAKQNHQVIRVYSREIMLENEIDVGLLHSILRESINDKYTFVHMVLTEEELNEPELFNEPKLVSKITVQYNPFFSDNTVHYRFD